MKFSHLPITTIFRWNDVNWTKLTQDGEILNNDYRPQKGDAAHSIGYCPADTEVEVITDEATIKLLNETSCKCS